MRVTAKRTIVAVLLAMASAGGAQAGAAVPREPGRRQGVPPPVEARTLPPTKPLPPTDRVLVMPFEDTSGEGRIYWLREAASVLLTEDLASAGVSAIGREERLRAFERLGVPAGARLSEATVIRIGELLGASAVVVGTLGRTGDQLTVYARHIRLDTGRVQAEATETVPLPDLFRMFDSMLVRLFPMARPRPGHTEKDHAPLQAFENYIKGLVAETPAVQVKFLQAALASLPDYGPPRVALWQVYTNQGEHAKALAVALDVPASSPAYRRGRFLASLSDLQMKQYEAAFTILQALATQEPAAAIFNNLGVVQVRRPASGGQSSSATYYFNQAKELSPRDPDCLFNLGYSYLLEHDAMAAAYWLREAVRQNPADGEAHYVLGTALVATNAASEGAREKELARRLSSRFAEWDRRPATDPVPRGLERVKADLDTAGTSTEAFAFETTGQSDQRDLAEFYLDRGRRMFDQGNDRDAIAELQRALYVAPYQAEAHLLLGRINLRNGRVREAIDDLKISLWSQETLAAHLVLAEAYLQAKDASSARAEAQRALALDPASADAQKLLERIGGK